MKWISVEDRMPEILEEVLAYSKNHGYILASLLSNNTWDAYDNVNDITHWMPLPEAPR